MTRRFIIVVVGLCALGLSSVVTAQPRPRWPARASAQPQSGKKRVETMIFGDDLVRAGRESGAGGVIVGRAPLKMSSLISVRANFLPEMIKAAEAL